MPAHFCLLVLSEYYNAAEIPAFVAASGARAVAQLSCKAYAGYPRGT